ncbi:hypothetical protein ACERJO_17970, partial [Halalkalibacter sp. AB-rgal2]|uniref:hypothetical protein n=1 Tax=Halalkalibacter sp. AB-rgal2 TaxID=3242695 RepID=UPI00359EB0A9
WFLPFPFKQCAKPLPVLRRLIEWVSRINRATSEAIAYQIKGTEKVDFYFFNGLREGQVEIHRRSWLVQRPPAESVPPIPGARTKLPFKSEVNERFFSGLLFIRHVRTLFGYSTKHFHYHPASFEYNLLYNTIEQR